MYKNNFIIIAFLLFPFVIWCQNILPNKDYTTGISYKNSWIVHTLSCDEYIISTIRSLWYTGTIQQQWTGCIVIWIQHKFDIPSLDVAIVFDNQYSSYFLDQSKKPIIVLSGNEIVTSKEDSLIVIKNNKPSLKDFVSWYFVWCDTTSILSWSLEWQVICSTNNQDYWYHIQQSKKNVYITKTLPTAKTVWRYEIQ